MRTQVGIIGAGPAGLLLSRLLAQRGIDSALIEIRSRAYCEARQRAGVLEDGSVALLRQAGLAARLDAEGLVHGGIYLQFAGQREHIDFRDLTGGRTVTVYAQTEIVKDLIAERIGSGGQIDFNVSETVLTGIGTDRPVLSYRRSDGTDVQLTCDVIAGCDGFHGIAGLRSQLDGSGQPSAITPYSWLGILAEVPPSTDELIYAHHARGFALHSLRSPGISRMYLQVDPDEDLASWPDERVWSELAVRFALPGWELHTGPVLAKSITPMRSFVSEPMRYGRLFLAGDAAHIVPPTGAKGLNLAMADVAMLAPALDSLLGGDSRLADAYSASCLERVWRCTHFSWWMTSMLHRTPGADEMEAALQLAQLRYITTSRAAAITLAENYTGSAPLRRH